MMKKLLCLTALLFSCNVAMGNQLLPSQLLTGLQKNGQIKAAQARYKAALAEINEAKSEELPHLFAQLAGSWQGKEEKRPTYLYTFSDKWGPILGIDFPKYYNLGYTTTAFTSAYEAQLGFTWLLSSWGAVHHQVQSKKMAAEGLKAQIDRVKQTVEHATYQAYFGLIRARTLKALAEHYLSVTDEHVTQVELFLKQGVIAQADLYRAKAAQADAQSKVAEAEQGEKKALSAIKRLTDIDATHLTTPTVQQLGEPPLLTEKPQRPELLALDNGKKAALSGAAAASKITAPKLFAQGSVVAQGRDFWPDERKDWKIALALRWDFADGGKAKALKQKAMAKAEELDALTADLENQIDMEIAEAHQGRDLAKVKIEALKQEAFSAAELTRVAKLKKQHEAGTEIELLDALLKEHNANSDLLGAQLDLWERANDLAFALGVPLFDTSQDK